MGFSDKAQMSEMEQKAWEKCGKLIAKLEECAPDGIASYQLWKWKCQTPRKELEICLGRYGRDEAVLKELKSDYNLHPKGGKGPAEP